MQLNQVFKLDQYSEAFDYISKNGYTIKEIDKDSNGERQFKIIEIAGPSQKELIESQIYEIKEKLAKYKEDVEQVELFDMSRDDYEEKKKLCSEMILQLRELEKTIKTL